LLATISSQALRFLAYAGIYLNVVINAFSSHPFFYVDFPLKSFSPPGTHIEVQVLEV